MALLLSYSTWGMPTVPIETAVAHCARLGFDGLELTVIPGWSTDAATLDRAARQRIRALYDQHEHARNMARLRSYLDLAAELQRPGEHLSISTTSGGQPEYWERAKGKLV